MPSSDRDLIRVFKTWKEDVLENLSGFDKYHIMILLSYDDDSAWLYFLYIVRSNNNANVVL